MRVSRHKLTDFRETLGTMKRLATQYSDDVNQYVSMPLNEFYDIVKTIPYRMDVLDGELHEIVKRPFYTLNQFGPGGDCDDKAVVMAAWAYKNRIPFRFKAVGRTFNGNYHHTYPEFYLKGKWIPVDATYPHNTLGRVSNFQREYIYA